MPYLTSGHTTISMTLFLANSRPAATFTAQHHIRTLVPMLTQNKGGVCLPMSSHFTSGLLVMISLLIISIYSNEHP